MIVNTDQIRIGVKKFIESEIAQKATGLTKFMIYFTLPSIDASVVNYLNQARGNFLFEDMFDEAGNVVLGLRINGTTRYTVTATATAAGTVNVTIPFEVYIPGNCCASPINIPAYIQVQSTGVALTSGTSNLIIDKE